MYSIALVNRFGVAPGCVYALLSAGLDSCTGFLMEVSLTPSAKSGP